jgi:hypothetical protein
MPCAKPQFEDTFHPFEARLAFTSVQRRRFGFRSGPKAPDFAVRRFLHELGQWWEQQPAGRRSLLPFRDDFRAILRRWPVQGLMWMLLNGEEAAKPVVIWLLGRCPFSLSHLEIRFYLGDPNRTMRRQALKALRRLGPFADPHAQPKVEFSTRLTRFLAEVALLPEETHPGHRMRFWSLVPLPITSWIRPKSAALIREILERIHRLVHGGNI